jgi:hypothetical protein
MRAIITNLITKIFLKFKSGKTYMKTNSNTAKSSNITAMRCYMEHQPLSLGGDKFILGGCCIDHDHLEADVYIGLDDAMMGDSSLYPWSDKEGVLFYIPDMRTPANFEEFDNMINWIQDQINDGKTVHVGCLGGHGRTGMVLSALAYKMLGIEDAITYVRDNYCEETVETMAQVKWLNKHYGIKVVDIASVSWGGYLSNIYGRTFDDSPLDDSMDAFYLDNDYLEELEVFPCDEKSSLSIFSETESEDIENAIELEVFNAISLTTIIEGLGKIFRLLDEEQIFGVVDKEIFKDNEKVGYHLTLYFMDIYFDEAYILLDDSKEYAYISNSNIPLNIIESNKTA